MYEEKPARRLLCALVLLLTACGCSRNPAQILFEHPLQATMTPGEATLPPGESTDFVVTIAGGAVGASATWSCATSNPAIAGVAVIETGCRATALTAGNTTIRATVAKGSEVASATSRLTVNTVSSRGCPAGSPRWMTLPVCEEGARRGYDRDAFGQDYSSLEDEIVARPPPGRLYAGVGESGGGAVPVGYGAISARFRGGAQSGSHRSVSTPCSPNPACGFPAPGSPVGPCASHTERRTRNLRRTGGLRATSSQKLHGFTRIEPCPARRQACLRPDDIRPSQNARLARLLRLCM